MINFRTLKQDFSSSLLRDGKQLFEKGIILSAEILDFSKEVVRISSKVSGNFQNTYTSQVEICLHQSMIRESDCSCTQKYDCQHLAALVFHLEAHYDAMLLHYSKETHLTIPNTPDASEKEELQAVFALAATKEQARQTQKQQKELLEEYTHAAHILGISPLFQKGEHPPIEKADLCLLMTPLAFPTQEWIEVQLAIRPATRSKPHFISDLKSFLEEIANHELVCLGGKRYLLSSSSFDAPGRMILKTLVDFAKGGEIKSEKNTKFVYLQREVFGNLLGNLCDWMKVNTPFHALSEDSKENIDLPSLPHLFLGSIEHSLRISPAPARMLFTLDYLQHPSPKIFLKASLACGPTHTLSCEEAIIFAALRSGILHEATYYPFPHHLKRKHLMGLSQIRDMTIPEPLFGTFVENALPELKEYAEITNLEAIEQFVTLPFVHPLRAECHLQYLDGLLEASLSFIYDKVRVPAAPTQLSLHHLTSFVAEEGVLARNLSEEQKILQGIFQDFFYDSQRGIYHTKLEKKIIEFMTETVPAYQHLVQFHCPPNLLDQFVYDNTTFSLQFTESEQIACYEVQLQVVGHLQGVSLEQLWDCILSKRLFLELSPIQEKKRKVSSHNPIKRHKILILSLEKLVPIVHLFDEIGLTRLDNHTELRPLWSLANLDPQAFQGLPLEIHFSKKLQEIQKQMLGQTSCEPQEISPPMQALLRNYQIEGVHWLDRLRQMYLNGILADDMGLGKTLQAMIVLAQFHHDNPKKLSLIVAPTSLVYNWREEFTKFHPHLKVLIIDGTPQQRKKLLGDAIPFDVLITSYTLLQKDLEFYKTISFGYVILDEGQHIKNRATRNAQSAKQLTASHKLILTGTPIENALDELWSLFDFLMPGLLSSYERFVERYLRQHSSTIEGKHLENLKKKVSPFILRRMKKDVLQDLPPISEITYYCNLSDVQKHLYSSYASSAREELSQLVKKEGFEKVQIHVLATLTRLKQICCHPAIFAKDHPEPGDSAKYDLLLELLETIQATGQKTIIFSQYTKMLAIMREDFHKKGIPFEYLDGSTKNRLSIVKKFNEDQNVPIFLVSLKAGGTGLNLTGAQVVFHYDLWWNPAVKRQATDRAHRMGQKFSVSSYDLITRGTIEEKIVELHSRKQGLLKEVVNLEEDLMAKLTWEEVLQLLQAPL